MLKKFKDYLDDIGMIEDAFVERADRALKVMGALMPGRITDMLIEEVVQENGARQYLHLTAFSAQHIGGASNFLTADMINVYPLDAGIVRLGARASGYDFRDATPDSRLYVEFVISGVEEGAWSLSTSGDNCNHAWDLVQKHIKSRL